VSGRQIKKKEKEIFIISLLLSSPFRYWKLLEKKNSSQLF